MSDSDEPKAEETKPTWIVSNQERDIVNKVQSANTFYQTLQVPLDASEQLIKAQYCILEEQLHHEVNAAPNAPHAYNKVVLAYRVLADPYRR